MSSKAKAVPEGYHTLTAYIVVRNAGEAIAFYRKAFGAVEVNRFDMPGGKIGHAELTVGDSRLMLADEMPEMPDAIARSPRTLGGTSFGFHIYLEDVDARFEQAVAAGATVRRPVQDQFYGDRSGTLEDPFGHLWTLSTHVEDVSLEEMKTRMAAKPAHG
jgi:PhnB protein